MRQYHIEITVDGATTAGDITVSGFATVRTATEVAFVITEALRQHFDGAHVTADVERDA